MILPNSIYEHTCCKWVAFAGNPIRQNSPFVIGRLFRFRNKNYRKAGLNFSSFISRLATFQKVGLFGLTTVLDAHGHWDFRLHSLNSLKPIGQFEMEFLLGYVQLL